MIKLRDICTVVSGTTPKSNKPEYWDGNINWVTPAELTDDSDVIFESQRKITEKAIVDCSLKPFPAGTVLLSSRAPIGKVAIAGVEMYCNQGFKNLICSDKIYNRYLYYYLKYKTDYLNSLGRGATFKEISKSIVENIEIPLPPLDEQRKIAAMLDKVSDLIAKHRQQLDKLDELVKSRFIEMFGDPITNSMKLPTEQMDKRYFLKAGLTTAAEDIHAYSEGSYEIPCYGGNGIRGYVEEKSYEGEYPIIGRQGALCGNVQFASGRFHATEHAVLVSLLKGDNTVWTYHMLKLMDLYRYHTGAAQPGLAVKTLNTVDVIVADISRQNQFASFVKQVDKSKLAIKQSLEKLETLRKSLMQHYFG